MDIVLTLTFSIVLLFFMIYPAIKITEWIDNKFKLPQKLYTPIMLFIVLFLSIATGIFLKFA